MDHLTTSPKILRKKTYEAGGELEHEAYNYLDRVVNLKMLDF